MKRVLMLIVTVVVVLAAGCLDTSESTDTAAADAQDVAQATDTFQAADQTQGDGASRDQDETDTVPSHQFAITIVNQGNASLFVDALWLPFGLRQGEQGFSLFGYCECSRCGSGEPCSHAEPMAMVVELPAGQQLTAEAHLRWYTHREVDENSCPEAVPWIGWCDEPHAFEPGDYTVLVAYDDQSAIAGQDLVPSDQTRWGYTVWWPETMTIGTAHLSQRAEQSFSLSGDATAVTVTIP